MSKNKVWAMFPIDLQDKLHVEFVHAVVHGETQSTAGNLTVPAHGLERSSAGTPSCPATMVLICASWQSPSKSLGKLQGTA